MKLVPEHIDEAMSFQRGLDPKKSLDIGIGEATWRTLKVGDVLKPKKRINTSFKGRILDTKYAAFYIFRTHEYYEIIEIVEPRFPNIKSASWGLKLIEVSDRNKSIKKISGSLIKLMNRFELIPRSEAYSMKAVKESMDFQRGQDPKKTLGIGGVRPYPDMTVDQFRRWFAKEIVPYLDDDGEQAIVDNLLMNDWEADWEIAEYLRGRNLSPDIVADLMYMRGYFNDREYIRGLFDENLF